MRELARTHDVSPFSAAEVYNVLVAAGIVEVRAGLGYFVGPLAQGPPRAIRASEFPSDSVWERRREAAGQRIRLDAGCGWLPAEWLNIDSIRVALRSVARGPALRMDGYGDPFGFTELRGFLAKVLARRSLYVTEEQIVLTQGASQALDLVVRECLGAGDNAIVEDPGYPPLFEMLRNRGVRILRVPRAQNGPDLDAVQRLVTRRRVRVLFTNTTFQNPTGTSTSAAAAHALLELAAKHDFLIVEDDIFAELSPSPGPSVSSLDSGCGRVVYISSFSKTISPRLRTGFLVTTPERAQRIVRLKVMSSLGSSELLEQVALEVLTHGHYRHHAKHLACRLEDAHVRVQRSMQESGVELAFRPRSGLFLWARLPSPHSASKLWRMALTSGVLLAPGELFSPEAHASRYWRFNVAQCTSPLLKEFLEQL